MEVRILGKIKSDGYRFLAKLYRLIINVVQEKGESNLSFEDKGYIGYFANKLNKFELLKQKKQKLLGLISGYIQNTKRLFKRDGFRLYFNEPKGVDPINNYDRYYHDRMRFTGEGVDLLTELSVLSSQVRKLVKYYNAVFYKEVCSEYISHFCEKLVKETDFKAGDDNDAYHALEKIEDFSNMNDVSKQIVVENISLSLIGKIMDIRDKPEGFEHGFVHLVEHSIERASDAVDREKKEKMDWMDTLEEYFIHFFQDESTKQDSSHRYPIGISEDLNKVIEIIQNNPDNKVFLSSELLYDFDKLPTHEESISKLDDYKNEILILNEKIQKTELLYFKQENDPYEVFFYHLVRLKYKRIAILDRVFKSYSVSLEGYPYGNTKKSETA